MFMVSPDWLLTAGPKCWSHWMAAEEAVPKSALVQSFRKQVRKQDVEHSACLPFLPHSCISDSPSGCNSSPFLFTLLCKVSVPSLINLYWHFRTLFLWQQQLCVWRPSLARLWDWGRCDGSTGNHSCTQHQVTSKKHVRAVDSGLTWRPLVTNAPPVFGVCRNILQIFFIKLPQETLKFKGQSFSLLKMLGKIVAMSRPLSTCEQSFRVLSSRVMSWWILGRGTGSQMEGWGGKVTAGGSYCWTD